MENPKKITTIGGQALMEGIMMVGPKRTVAAFCDEEGNISTEEISVPRLTKQYPLLGKPFIRGIFALADSFRMGYKALSLSADKLTEGDEEEELTGLDKWLNDHLGEKITGVIMARRLCAGHRPGGGAVLYAAHGAVQPAGERRARRHRRVALHLRGRPPHRAVCGLCGPHRPGAGHQAHLPVPRRRT